MKISRLQALIVGVAIVAVAGAAAVAYESSRAPAAEGGRESSGLLGGLFSPEQEARDVPPGTLVTVRLTDSLDSGNAEEGAPVEAVVDRAVRVDGVVVIPEGAPVTGEVTEVRPARRLGGKASLTVVFREISPPHGPAIPVSGSVTATARSQTGKDAATIAGSAVGGALLGDAVGDEPVVGAVVGGGIGTAVASRRGPEAVLPAGRAVVLRTVPDPLLHAASS